jgi:hypothetical protein
MTDKTKQGAKKMAETVTVSKNTITIIGIVITVIAAMAFWKDRGGDQATAALNMTHAINSNTARNDSQDVAIAEVNKRTEKLEETEHEAELARTRLQGAVDRVADNQATQNVKLDKVVDYIMQYEFHDKKED